MVKILQNYNITIFEQLVAILLNFDLVGKMNLGKKKKKKKNRNNEDILISNIVTESFRCIEDGSMASI